MNIRFERLKVTVKNIKKQLIMIKKEILSQIVRDNLLHDKIFRKLKYRQATISQSFKRCLERGKISGRSHDPAVLEIIQRHLKLTPEQLLD
jgi:hypothetical protein